MAHTQPITQKKHKEDSPVHLSLRFRWLLPSLIALYLAAIIGANLLIVQYGPRVAVLNAFLFIGLDLTCRDRLHDAWRKRGLKWKMGLLIAAGSLLSWAFNADAGRVALASFLAFAAGASLDTYAYARLEGFARLLRVNGSNLAGAAVDSLVFAWLLGVTPLAGVIWAAKVFGGLLWSLLL